MDIVQHLGVLVRCARRSDGVFTAYDLPCAARSIAMDALQNHGSLFHVGKAQGYVVRVIVQLRWDAAGGPPSLELESRRSKSLSADILQQLRALSRRARGSHIVLASVLRPKTPK